uniref:Uncharacterized protein n=1 Tax=Aegilops tauschii TaxID=37682 RepID=N1QV91_AEGTA
MGENGGKGYRVYHRKWKDDGVACARPPCSSPARSGRTPALAPLPCSLANVSSGPGGVARR